MRRAPIVASVAVAIAVAGLVGGSATVALAAERGGEVAAAPVAPVPPELAEQEVAVGDAGPAAPADADAPTEPELQPAAPPQSSGDMETVAQVAGVASEPRTVLLAPGEDTTHPVVWAGGIEVGQPYELGTTFTLDYTCDDPESDIMSCTENHGYVPGDTVRLTTLGYNVFTVTGVNGEGMVWTYSLEVFAQIPELQPVRVVFDGNRESYGGWFNAPITASLRAWSETPVPLRDIHYRIDGGEWETQAGEVADVPFPAEGSYLLEYVAFDENLTTSTLRRQWVQLDFVAPELLVPFEDGAVFEQDAELLLEPRCSDERSGMSLCGSESAYLRTSDLGPNQVRFTATDVAGNVTERIVPYMVVAAGDGDGDGDDDGGEGGGDGGYDTPDPDADGGASDPDLDPVVVSDPHPAGALASTGADALGSGILAVSLVSGGLLAVAIVRRSRGVRA